MYNEVLVILFIPKPPTFLISHPELSMNMLGSYFVFRVHPGNTSNFRFFIKMFDKCR